MSGDPEGRVQMQPSMGPATTQYKLLLNVIPRGGKLERRPSVKAVRLGFGYPGRDATANYGFQHNADGTSTADYTDQGGHAAATSSAGVTPIVFDDRNGQYVGKFWTSYSMVPVDQTQDLSSSAPVYERQDIVEGIDVEIVNGKLICFYAARHRIGQTTGADSYAGATIKASHNDVKMRVSAHSLASPSIGRLLFSQKESLNLRSGSMGMALSSLYATTQYWNKRIARIGKGFMLTGYGVGGSRWNTGNGWDQMIKKEFSTDIAADVTQVNTTISDPDGLLLFNGEKLPFYKIDDPVYNLDRYDETNTIYAERRPRNAFVFLDSEGQPIWYGFNRADNMEMMAAIGAANVLISGEHANIDSTGTKMRVSEGTIWFAESMNPHSLPVQGYMTAVTSSRSPEVVGFARYGGGTAVFTRDTIEYAQGYFSAKAGQIKLIHTGVGADARWCIKEVGNAVAFLSKDGIYHLKGNDITRVNAFDGLFNGGVEFERTPYSDLVVGDATTETVSNHANSAYSSRYAQGLDVANKWDSLPFGHYRVDKTRLDRAVAGVWEDLYLCAVSREIDDPGDDNRMVLCWNYKENLGSVWILPKYMGMRGFAYDGSISTPYIMTRYGLAEFAGSKERDMPYTRMDYSGNVQEELNSTTTWRTRVHYEHGNVAGASATDNLEPESHYATGSSATVTDVEHTPVVMAGQTQFLHIDGSAFTIPEVSIMHEKNQYGWARKGEKDQDDWAFFLKDDDIDMRIQVWGNQTDIEAGTMGENYGNSEFSSTSSDYDMKSLSMSDIGMLDSLYKGNNEKEFRAIRVHPENVDGGTKKVDHTHGHMRYGSGSFSDADQMPTRRTRGSILKTSTGRSGTISTKQQVQFYTIDTGDIHAVSIAVDVVVKPGGRS